MSITIVCGKSELALDDTTPNPREGEKRWAKVNDFTIQQGCQTKVGMVSLGLMKPTYCVQY